MEASVSLSGENFNEFLRVVSLLKEPCSDIDICNGYIRQRSNENSCIFEIDMTSLLTEEISVPIIDIKQKLDLLKIFTDQEVTITVTDEVCTFADQYSSLVFKNPNRDFVDNKFMPEEELNAVFSLDEDSLILSTEIPTTISDRISAVKQGFSVTTVKVSIDGEVANISAITQAKDQHAMLMEGIVTEMTMNCETDLLIVPFVIDHDGDMDFKMYNAQDEVSINKFETSIGDMSVIVYSRSSIVDNAE